MKRRIYQYETRSGRYARWIAARSPEDAHREARKHGWRPFYGLWDGAEIITTIKGRTPAQLRALGVDVVLP